MTSAELRRLARLGAEARLEAVQREISAIYATFPELRRGRPATKPSTDGATQARKGTVTPHPRRTMSREARKRIAEAQRKRWAEWKAKQTRADAAAGVQGRTTKASRKKR
jgi:hypothetical protein